MKIPLIASAIILAVGASLGWHDLQQLGVARATHANLVAEAATLGIAPDPAHPAEAVRITKHERVNREADAKLAAAEFIAFAKEMEAQEKSGGKRPDEAMQKRIMEMMDRMMSLDSGQLKILVAELRADKQLKDETRQGLIGFSIMTLANEHPQAALALFTESSDLFKDGGMGKHVISSSLARWAKDDPLAALEWVRKNGATYPDLVTDDAKCGLISGAASQDPKLAFKLIAELGFKDTSDALGSIVRAAKTPDERTATLAALREHLSTISNDKARGDATTNSVRALLQPVAEDGFAAASKWLASANLSPAELAGFADGLNSSNKSGETGQWVEWIGQQLPADQAESKISGLVRNWTRNDYQAAGKWLSTTPDSPAKTTAICSYAETVAGYEPEVAAQWALTLPAGKTRDATLRNIYHHWPKGDPAAAAAAKAFATEHGIK